MKKDNSKKNEDQNPLLDYNPADRDFQRTKKTLKMYPNQKRKSLKEEKNAFMRGVQNQTRIKFEGDVEKSKGHSTL